MNPLSSATQIACLLFGWRAVKLRVVSDLEVRPELTARPQLSLGQLAVICHHGSSYQVVSEGIWILRNIFEITQLQMRLGC